MNETATAIKGAREATKSRHRLAMIEATADAICDHGLGDLSISRILERAGLSRGMVNLHFSSKNKLLLEVARYFSEAYADHWQKAMTAAGPHPEDRLRAIIAADFDPSVLNRRTMAVWFAFRGDAHSVPDYLPYVDSRESRMETALHEICDALCADGAYPNVDTHRAVQAFVAILEGLWTDFHLHPDRFRRDEARRVVMHVAQAFFPNHFTTED
ncbi:MAG: TetR/AcrR family transcriptional regulator [Albidovulum sp.]